MSKAARSRGSDISELTTRRLAVYLRCLGVLEAAGVETVSSKEIAEQFHLNSAQFRKDLACFGEFGVRGVGYRVPTLKKHLVEILGLDRQVRLAIIGAGNLGQALAGYDGFNREGFRIVGLFDDSPAKIGTVLRGGVEVYDVARLSEVVARVGVDIALLAVPVDAGQEVLDQAVAAGIQAILNFVPVRLKVPPSIKLKTVDLKVQVEALAYHLNLAREEHQAAAGSSS
ncbi:MAG: redox-sensing transcriptional repressor Rex [Acidobacteriota bacterium]